MLQPTAFHVPIRPTAEELSVHIMLIMLASVNALHWEIMCNTGISGLSYFQMSLLHEHSLQVKLVTRDHRHKGYLDI